MIDNPTRQFITLDSVITDYFNESEQSNHKYFKCFHLGFRGMDMLGLDFFYTIRSIKIPVASNKTALLPPDYLNYTKVGVLNGIGEIIPLKYNSKLTTYADLLPDRIGEKTQDNTLFEIFATTSPIWFNYWNGSDFVNLYGLPSGSPYIGNFKIDDANGVILLDENFGYEYIMLEYVATPTNGQDYFLPVQFREALIAWLWWKDGNAKSVRSHMELGARRDWRHEFYNERRLANARYRPLYLEQAYELNLEMTRMTVKA
jgi:hypothetical protein